jgi:D-alanyl-D-alanine dipeptidase
MRKWFSLITLFLVSNTMALPKGFVYLEEVNPSIIQEMKYMTYDNFIGRPITGYENAKCILTEKAAFALSAIQEELKKQALGLKVYDCYRPQTAVQDFIRWSQDAADQKMKAHYYPNVNKADFFKLGYMAEKSGHTRGSTVDLTIVHLSSTHKAPIEMVMGTHFDFMDVRSHTLNEHIQGQARHNRLFLQTFMEQGGFMPYDKEWWHFTLRDEPFPETYFDFPIS